MKAMNDYASLAIMGLALLFPLKSMAESQITWAEGLAGKYTLVDGKHHKDCHKNRTLIYTEYRPVYKEFEYCRSELRVLPDDILCNPNNSAYDPINIMAPNGDPIKYVYARTGPTTFGDGLGKPGGTLEVRNNTIILSYTFDDSSRRDCEYKKVKPLKKEFYDMRTGETSYK